MENAEDDTFDQMLAQRLKGLRTERGWSLDELAMRTGVSRATLSRLENAEVSPTANVLGKIGTAYGLTTSRLLRLVEDDFVPLVRAADQQRWTDPDTGFTRRVISPPSQRLSGEVLEGDMPAGKRIVYETSPRPGLEHHLYMLEGRLRMTVDGRVHLLEAGDCLRFQLFNEDIFETPAETGARYLIFIV